MCSRPIRMLIAALTAPLFFASSAFADGDSRLYDGVSMDDLYAILSNISVDGQKATVIRRQTAAGNPYLILSAPTLADEITISGIENAYGGEGMGVYSGMLILSAYGAGRVPPGSAQALNEAAFFLKVIEKDSVVLFRGEVLAAGGVTDQVIVNSLVVFDRGRRLALTSGGSVSVNYAAPYANSGSEMVGNDGEQTKHLMENRRPLIADRLIEAAIDAVAQ